MNKERLLKAHKHLSKDKILWKVIKNTKYALKDLAPKDTYAALLEKIISQQLSIKAADTIYQRFVGHFGTTTPSYTKLLRTRDTTLRKIGLSGQKTGYTKNVARFFKENETLILKGLEDQEIIELLTSIKGVGTWTVHMLLMFDLSREDVFPSGDLVIQKQMRALYGIKSEKKLFLTDMENIASSWSPYRTIASRYLWSRENNL